MNGPVHDARDGGGSGVSAEGGHRPRWLLVVQHAQRDLYEVLRDQFEELGIVVILDRRRAERRRESEVRVVDRRRMDRRQRRPIAWMYPAETSDLIAPDLGRLEFTAGPIPTAAPGRASGICRECGITVGFELPRFEEPPARLTVTILHRTDPTFGVQHFVDVVPFTAAGRPLPSQRVQAQREVRRR
jgi:hypothetical protein